MKPKPIKPRITTSIAIYPAGIKSGGEAILCTCLESLIIKIEELTGKEFFLDEIIVAITSAPTDILRIFGDNRYLMSIDIKPVEKLNFNFFEDVRVGSNWVYQPVKITTLYFVN